MSTTDQKKPIFMATHPRACSTVFERAMMTRTDALTCIHEPFGDAFYYGPERLGLRFSGNSETAKKERFDSGFEDVTFADVVQRIDDEKESGKRIFIKDITHYLLPPVSYTGTVYSAPSLRLGLNKRKGYGTSSSSGATSTEQNGQKIDGIVYPEYGSKDNVAPEDLEPRNPTVLPLDVLRKFHFTFLIRHPRRAVPSYYRCCIPPQSEVTGFDYFLPEEAGYRELREFFDYVRAQGLVGEGSDVELFVLDADDLQDAPKEAIEAYCKNVGIDFKEEMLVWGEGGCAAFDKWKGFHDDAIKSTGFRPRATKKEKSAEQEYTEWVEKYGEDGAKLIKKTVDENMGHYEYLKQFKVNLGA